MLSPQHCLIVQQHLYPQFCLSGNAYAEPLALTDDKDAAQLPTYSNERVMLFPHHCLTGYKHAGEP